MTYKEKTLTTEGAKALNRALGMPEKRKKSTAKKKTVKKKK